MILRWIRRLRARYYTHNIAQRTRETVAVFETWSDVPMGCCDCGLMHRYDFSVNADGKLCVRARRDVAMTAALRSVRVFPIVITVHPANVRPPVDERDRRLRVRDQIPRLQ